ncbi:MAG: rhomboid family intramembrane serine protease [Bacteroidales bacterium]|nr:rhomboid family intramembrane serine protease [Bacteroidales bacterium]
MNKQKQHKKIETFRFFSSLALAVLLTSIMWIVKFFETTLNFSFVEYGVLPHTLSGLKGILFSPFIHGSFNHLFSNSFPFLILTTLLFNVYYKKRFLLFFLLYFLSGILLWTIGRNSYHIGASGVIYALAAFIFFAGILSKNREHISISLIVIFLYGGFIWGLFPVKDTTISWEGHLSGFIAGAFLSLFFHHQPKIDSSLIEEPKNIDLIYAYDYKTPYLISKYNFFYTFIPKNTNSEKYIINYETNFYTNSSNAYNFSTFSSTPIF